ncbi:MAG: PKD domain-containing protein [Cytophagaceae bacterium]|nr:PKD domain-containing protein [Cytophagaceae bacterium]
MGKIMPFTFKQKVIFFSFMLLSLSIFSASAADVLVNVNLSHQISQGLFTIGSDQISVLGSFSATPISLTDTDGDKIYSGTLTGLSGDNQITYNFRITRAAGVINETITARKYVVQPNSNANELYNWFNNQLPAYPYSKFFASTIKTIPGEVIRFFEESEGGSATAWSWNFPGATPSTSTSKTPTVVYSSPGTYEVTLTASNGIGSTTSKTLSITITSIDEALSWWNDQVFYQVYPWSFLDTDGNGTGDIRGIINKLDYLNDGNAITKTDLGITALYVMPVHPATNVNYGGYEITDFKVILSQLGSQSDFDELVSKAHARGIKVIMDMVFNHSSAAHPWFNAARAGNGSQYEDYYVFNNSNAVNSWGWRDNSSRSSNTNFKYFWSQFNGEATADFNFRNLSTRNAIKDISSHWLTKNIDGFRLDAPIYFYGAEDGGANTDRAETYNYVREWSAHTKKASPNSFTVGESWFEGCYTGKIDALVATAAKYVYQGFDLGFQFNIAYGIQDALNLENKANIIEPMEASMKYYPNMQFGVFHSNHDTYNMCAGNYTQLRLKDRLNSAKDNKTKLATALVLTSPGVPFIYYGDEIGESGGYARKPMQWTNGANAGFTTGSPWEGIAGDYSTYNVASETNDPNSFLSVHRNLISIRLQEKALRRGGYKTLETSATGVYAFMRTYGSEVVFVILNLSQNDQSNVSLSVSGSSIPNGNYSLNNLLAAAETSTGLTSTGGNVSGWIPFSTIPGNKFYILKLNNQGSGPNSAPTIDAVASNTISVEDGFKLISLSGISDGNFCSQTVTVTATSSNLTVMQNPAVNYTSCNSTGTLPLIPVAAGTATINVTVKDNAGVANGGLDTKVITFVVTVNDIPKAPSNLLFTPHNASTSMMINWMDNSSRETGFNLYWSTTNTQPTSPNATVAANTTNYKASGLLLYTQYYFWVEAYTTSAKSIAITGTILISPPNIALRKAASASSYETFDGIDYLPSLAVDSINQNFANRWSSPASANASQVEWIKIDLLNSYNITKVKLFWENANADSYYIMTSNTNITPDPTNAAWTKVNYTGLANNARSDDHNVTLTGRYIAIYCYHKPTAYGYSLYELEVYGDQIISDPPSINSLLTANGTVGTNFSYLITATNNPTGYSATDLPAGLSINASTGEITGIPELSGVFSVNISATNETGEDTKVLVLTISTVTSVERSIESMLKVMPNPLTDGLLTLTIPNLIGIAYIEVENSQGSKITDTLVEFVDGESKLSLNNLSGGFYIIIVKKDNRNFVQKIIVP